ncbi:alpha/beta hydrolase family protein [Nocardia salmonicida]|uniref:alpha/beta fold hydrolase n=1 Tax=Nocardia salmonicida TaxID=53431 RepID=UPI0034303311
MDTDISVDLSDVTVRATVAGVGPTVLLLHAGGEDRRVWAPISARLAESGLRTVAYDLRGHGESTGNATTLRALRDDVIEMVRREPTPIVVVGASIGGLAALAALAEPTVARRVVGLVLVDVVAWPDPDRVRAWLGDLGLGYRRADLVEDTLTWGPRLQATAAASDLPILLVRAGRSPLSPADVDRFRAANPRITVTELSDVGHLVAQEAPAELARILSACVPGWLVADPVVRGAFEFQRTLGTEHIEHPGGTLHAHLHRVHALTVEWNAAPRAQLAAICHASYGTDGFAHALLPVEDRGRLRAVIGADAEALVYLYGACDRERTYRDLGQRPLTVIDRFTGESRAIDGTDLRDFAELTIVNELDVARHASLSASTREGIRDLVRALASYAPTAADRALADPRDGGLPTPA